MNDEILCVRCGWSAEAHDPQNPHTPCERFEDVLQPRLGLPDLTPGTDPSSPRAAWTVYDPEMHNLLVVLPEEDFTIAHRFVIKDGKAVRAEIRVYPTDPANDPFPAHGEWSHDPDVVPAEGLTARRFHNVKPGEAEHHLRQLLHRFEAEFGANQLTELLKSRNIPADLSESLDDLGPRIRKARHQQARFAAYYLQRLTAGSKKPTADTADHFFVSAARARDVLHDARRNNILTEAQQGVPGGTLTPIGERLLADTEAADQEPAPGND